MTTRKIPQRELRNNIGEVLRQAEAGTEFTITVRGRPVARLGPADHDEPRTDVPAETLKARLAATPVDPGFANDLRLLRELEAPVDNPAA